MRKIRMTSSTSINGMKLISGSSRARPARRSIWLCPLLALAVRELDQLDRLLLHLERQAVDFGAKVAIEDHARDSHDQPECGVIQRDRDAVRELDRVRAGGSLRAENLDHADNGAEQSEQRRHRGNRTESSEKSVEIVSDDVSDFFDRLLHHRARTLDVGKPGSKHAP